MKRVFFIFIFTIFTLGATPFTLMLNPAGDAQYTGRTIDCTFERGITRQCAEHLKKMIEKNYSDIHVMLTHNAGEILQPLQSASFANRSKIDLYISIHFYPALQEEQPTVDLYYFSLNPTTMQPWKLQEPALNFIPAHKAHILNSPTTKTITEYMYKTLLPSYKQNFDIHAPLGIPFAPLFGIIAPALGIEMSIKKSSDWQSWIPFLYESIEITLPLIRQKKQQKALGHE